MIFSVIPAHFLLSTIKLSARVRLRGGFIKNHTGRSSSFGGFEGKQKDPQFFGASLKKEPPPDGFCFLYSLVMFVCVRFYKKCQSLQFLFLVGKT